MTSYAISYAFSCLPGPDSHAAPLRLRVKSGPDPVQMRPCSNQMLPLLVPYVCLSSLASKSGCSGLLIHTRRRGHRFLPPLPPCPWGLFIVLLSWSSTTVVLRRCCTPLHKLMLEKRGELLAPQGPVSVLSDTRFRPAARGVLPLKSAIIIREDSASMFTFSSLLESGDSGSPWRPAGGRYPDQGPSGEWVNYAYRAAHPILRWLPSKLAEWIGDNYRAALGIPQRNDAAAW